MNAPATLDLFPAGAPVVTGSMVARLIESVGIDQPAHCRSARAANRRFFSYSRGQCHCGLLTLCHKLQKDLPDGAVVVSPDEGRVKMATEFARHLHCPLALLHKERRGGSDTRVTHVVGDVRDRPCLIIDDMISTGGTIAQAAEALLEGGAQPNIRVAATHGLFVGDARERLNGNAIRQLVVSDSVPPGEHHWSELGVVSLAPLLAGAVYRLQSGESLADLYDRVIHGGWKGF